MVGDDDIKHPIAPTSVASWRGEFLKSLYLAERATSSVEVGMAWGLSTMHIIEALLANGAKPRAHVVIDPMQSTRYHNAARRLLIEAGVEELVEFYEERSDLILPKLAGEGRQFDFAFIDGDHNFEAVFLDVVFVDRLLKPGGVAVLDDTWSHPVLMSCNFSRLTTITRRLPINLSLLMCAAWPRPRSIGAGITSRWEPRFPRFAAIANRSSGSLARIETTSLPFPASR